MSFQGRNQESHGIHFFKIILESSLRDGDLRIPRSFMKQYGKELSNPVLLRLPNGVKWKVDWTKRDGDIWFQKLWKTFAQYYPLSFGHFLVFRYEGRSNFQVLIFDTSALEIDYSSIRCTNEGEGTNKHYEDVEILDDNGRHKSPLLQPEKKMKTAERRCYINSLSENNEVAPSQRKKHDNTKIDFGFDSTKQKLTEGRRGSSSRSRRELENKCSKAYERAKNLKTEYPSFIQIMYPSYLKNFLGISAEFSRKYLNGLEGTATIWVKEDDKTWHIAFKFNTTNNKTILGTGWMTFVQDNNLKENDVCVFELIDRRNFSFKVTIFTFKEEEPSSEQIQANMPNQDKQKTPEPIQNMERGYSNGQFGEGTSRSNPKIDFVENSQSVNKKERLKSRSL